MGGTAALNGILVELVGWWLVGWLVGGLVAGSAGLNMWVAVRLRKDWKRLRSSNRFAAVRAEADTGTWDAAAAGTYDDRWVRDADITLLEFGLTYLPTYLPTCRRGLRRQQ